MLGRLDYDVAERVEAKLDSFIEKRAREKEDANKVEALWAASEARHRERRREENRRAWRAYHPSQALVLQYSAYSYRVWITLIKLLYTLLRHFQIDPHIHATESLCGRLLPSVLRVSEKNSSRQ